MQLAYAVCLPGLKKRLLHFLHDKNLPEFFTVESVYTAIRPAGQVGQGLEKKVKAYISVRLFQLEQKGLLSSVPRRRPKRYYRL